MSSEFPTDENSPDVFLNALENYQGRIHFLDNSTVIEADELRSGWKKLTRRFGEFGLCPGDRLIIAVGNGPLFIAVWGAVLACGGSPIPVHFETPPMELNRMACRFHASYIITDNFNDSDMEANESHAYSCECFTWGRIVWTDVYFNGENPGFDAQVLLPGVPMHPTSGTTGPAKLAVRPLRTAIAEIDNYVNTFGIDSSDTILGMTPMSHAFAHGFCAIGPIMTGADLAIMRKFQPALVVKACTELKISIVAAVASVFDTLLFTGGAALGTTTAKVFSGGGPLSERTARQFQKITGFTPRPLLGSTETGGIAVASENELCINGRVGHLFNGVTVRFQPVLENVDNENITPDETNSLATIQVQSKSLMLGYLNEELLDTSSVETGWFSTGDIGHFGEDGALYLQGRVAEVINVSGIKVLPREVEEVILSMKNVREVKVFGHKIRSGSYQVRAAVVGDNISAEDVRQHCLEQLVYYKRPGKIVIFDVLPRNANGKVAVAEIIKRVQEEELL